MDFSDENCILVSPKYKPLIEFLKQTKEEVKKIIISHLLDYYEDSTIIWQNYETFPFRKPYAPLIDFY
jgi:hypothetical protein